MVILTENVLPGAMSVVLCGRCDREWPGGGL